MGPRIREDDKKGPFELSPTPPGPKKRALLGFPPPPPPSISFQYPRAFQCKARGASEGRFPRMFLSGTGIHPFISPMYHQVPIEQRITKTSLIKNGKWTCHFYHKYANWTCHNYGIALYSILGSGGRYGYERLLHKEPLAFWAPAQRTRSDSTA